MASLSLPRVLQLKKNPLDVERENFEKFQSLSISKAINSQETPVKEKHVRSTIIGSFQEQGAVTYWVVAIRLPLQDNRIVAWKFCHVTHKLLREGHPACLDDSQRHIGMMENLGKLWVHLREGYGKLINLYTALLACKLRFHSRNPQFPGNMAVTAGELDAIAENDVNNYFQLCVELFDYMDDILNLQAAVFDSLGNARANSMTASGQCRLAALIPCAQDSSHIYDCNVRLLFRLHAALPPDTLSGHRERFRQQFKKLSAFYKHASTMQYFRNLLTLPQLPSNPPNFLIQSDFGMYVAPVVMIPEPEAEPEQDTVGSLIDTSDTFSLMTSPDSQDFVDSRTTPSPQPDLVLERDRLIEHLQAELRRQRAELTQMTDERGSMLVSMRDHCSKLEAELAHAKNAMEEEKQRAEILSAQTPEFTQKLNAVEERAKVTDDKFRKLKGAYTQLREEHIGLIRQKAEVDKLAASLRTASAEHESAKVALQQQLSDRSRDVEQLQQSSSNSEAISNELDTLRNEIVTLQTNLAQSREREKELEELKATVEETQQQHKTKTAEAQEQISRIEKQTRELSELLEKTKREKEEKENDLETLREEIVVLKDKSGEEFSKVVEEKEAAIKQVAALTKQFEQEKQEMGKQLEFIKNNITEVDLRETGYKEDINSLRNEIEIARNELENLKENKEKEVSELNNKISTLTNILKDNDENYQKNLLKQKEETESLKDILKKSSEESEISRQHILLLKDEEIGNLKNLLKYSSEKIEASQKDMLLKEEEIQNLKGVLKESSEISEASQKELHLKDEEIEKMKKQLKETSEKCEAMEKDVALKDSEIEYLEDVLGKTSEEKEHTYEALKSELEEKENKINALTSDVDNLSADLESVKNEMEEREAELEITKNEFISLKKKHADYTGTADKNLANASELLDKYKKELDSVVSEKQGLLNQISIINLETVQNEKEYNEKISNLQNSLERLQGEHNRTETEKDATITDLSNQVAVLTAERNQIKSSVTSEVQRLQEELHISAIKQNNDNQIFEQKLLDNKAEMEALNSKIEELNKEKEEAITNKDVLLRQYEEENKNLERKFEHSEKERLTAECELQDLLQHNTSLEDNLNAVKNQLQQAQQELETYRASMVRTAAEAGAELLQDALGELERGASPASGAQAAERASLALHHLAAPASTAGDHQMDEKETAVARSVVRAAHHTAQLATHTGDLLATLTDHNLVDSVTSETRTMLTLTKQCMEELARGEHAETRARAEEARTRVAALAERTAAAAAARGAARCVDDELADMDRAIEEAADRIEEMLAASRAADSGVKLEVNNKILDACTMLMGAVKVLVQDARRLQSELGDPKTRLNMYRRNPQWSEGLISAAKAVVVSAKLLVTSADEAVCGAGAIEGVSAASHEVAGSTAQLVAASRARAPPASPALAALSQASRNVAAATGAVVAAVRAASALTRDHDDLETSALTLTATRRLEMESKVRSLELESALDAERARLAALRRRHYQLAQQEENGNMTNGGH